jgi:hypothetical protein
MPVAECSERRRSAGAASSRAIDDQGEHEGCDGPDEEAD